MAIGAETAGERLACVVGAETAGELLPRPDVSKDEESDDRENDDTR